jgi:SAM-dependent methyltransferase
VTNTTEATVPAPRSGGDAAPPTLEERLAQARAYYDEALAHGIDRFFEPPRDTCPWCGSPELRVRLRSADLIQRKPGTFTLTECRTCLHLFQNPRLSLAGLDFYYRDFYDGLGKEVASGVFAMGAPANQARAEVVKRFTTPATWLDVGTGHGYFALHAKEILPGTAFDGLDLGDGVVDAERNGWLGRGYRGLFPDLAPELAGRYDVVSMHHYLEHTRDPRAELDALATSLKPGGYALIEMPNPNNRLGRMLRSWSVPLFQPQHQHLIPEANLLAALAERGFTPVSVEHGPAHGPVELTFALIFLMTIVGPDPRRPWLDPPAHPRLAAKRHELVWGKAYPPLMKAVAKVDLALGELVKKADGGNAYRILARRDG